MTPRKAILWVGLAFGLVLSARPAFASAITFSAAGADIASITPTVDAFRAALGGGNNGNAAGPLANGRREINWDGGGAATTSTLGPLTTFQGIRGALFTTPGTGFLQAPPAGLDTFFGRIDGFYDGIFDPFSAQRVFTPVGSNITDVTFFVPGTGGAAAVTAFGAVFLDVDTANVSSLQFFNLDGGSLGTFFVPALVGQNTFSFLAVQFDAGELVGRVRITTGNQLLGPANTSSIRLGSTISSSPNPRPCLSRRLLCFCLPAPHSWGGACGGDGERRQRRSACLKTSHMKDEDEGDEGLVWWPEAAAESDPIAPRVFVLELLFAFFTSSCERFSRPFDLPDQEV